MMSELVDHVAIRGASGTDFRNYCALLRSLSTNDRYYRFLGHVRECEWATFLAGIVTPNFAFVAETTGGLAGFLNVAVAPDRSAEVAVFVGPDVRRRGIASRLLDRAISRLVEHSCRVVIASVSTENQIAPALLRSRGFRRCEIHYGVATWHLDLSGLAPRKTLGERDTSFILGATDLRCSKIRTGDPCRGCDPESRRELSPRATP